MKYGLWLLCLLFVLPALAQEQTPTPSLPDPDVFARLAQEAEAQVLVPAICDDDCERLRGAMTIASMAELELVTSTRAAAFAWHHLSTVMIFWLVLVVVLAGLALAAHQFFKGKDTNMSTFKISLTGIEASSSGVGLLMFLISIAFFYLYLVYVYPINLLESG